MILVIGVVMFGPEKLPQFSRKAARIFVYLRDIANNAKTSIGNELGPEYANLELKDLNPKTFIAKQLQNEVALIDEAKRELKDAQEALKSGVGDAKAATSSTGSAIAEPAGSVRELEVRKHSPFDPEST